MPIWYPPPPPNVSNTGAQPYAGNKLPPAIMAVPVNNPAFTDEGRYPSETGNEIRAAWNDDPWPYLFEGGKQPYAGRLVNNVQEAVPVNNPPFTQVGRSAPLIASVVAAWQPAYEPWQYDYLNNTYARQPYGLSQLPPSLTAVPVNNPPPVSEGRYPNATPNEIIAIAWVPDPSYYTFVGGLQPFDSRNLNPAFESVLVNNPPGVGVPKFVELPDPLPQQPGRFNPAVFAPPAQPFRFDLSSILSAWQPDPFPRGFALARPKQLNPQLIAVEVDNPPGLLTDIIFYDVGRRLPPQSRGPLNPALTAVLVNNPPVSYQTWLSTVLGSWQPPDPLPTLSGKLSPQLTAVPVNNPPTIYPKGTRQLRFPWQPPDPQPQQLGVFVVQPFTAPSTRVPFTASWLPSVLGAWQLPDPPPVQKGPLNPQLTIPPVVNLPPGAGIPKVVTLPDDPLPQQAGKLSPGLIPAPVVNNPPFGGQRFLGWGWGSATVTPQFGGAFIQSVDNPPGLVSGAYSFWLGTILAAWQPADPPIQLPKYLTQAAPPPVVNNPPGFRIDLTGTLSAWQPGPPQPQTLGPFFTVSGAASTVNVPPGVGVPKFVIIDDPLPQLPSKVAALIPPAVVNNPPFPGKNGYWLTTVLVSWIPPDPPPVQRGPLNPSITAVPVNNPPFTNQGRTAQYWQAMAAWEIPLPPEPQRKPTVIIIQATPVKISYSYISSSYIQ